MMRLFYILGLGEKNKIVIDVDYYFDLFVSGDFKMEAEIFKFHTIDRFSWGGNLNCSSELKFGIESGGRLKVEYGDFYGLEAEFEGKVDAVWQIKNENNSLECKYQGLYVVIMTKFKSGSKRNNRGADDDIKNLNEKKFLLHDGFSYEFKLD